MSRVSFWLACALTALSSGAHADEISGTRDISGWVHRVARDERRPLPAEFTTEVDALRAQLVKLWKPPAAAKDHPFIVEISMKLNRDGTLAGPPEVLTSGDGALFKAARDSALNAIGRGQPFTMLKPEHYDQWKEVVVTFDSSTLPPR